jgi:limonene 1,2-monooxygenase
VKASRSIIVGTPEDAIARIRELQEISGGFGTLLCFAHEWAPTHKLMQSYELLMRYVAPAFQGHLDRLTWSRDFVEDNRRGIFGATPQAIVKAFADAGKQMPEALTQGLAQLRQRGQETPDAARVD